MRGLFKIGVCALVALPAMAAAFEAEARGAKRGFAAGLVTGKAVKGAQARERDREGAEAEAQTGGQPTTEQPEAPAAAKPAATVAAAPAATPPPAPKATAAEAPPAGGVTCFAGCYDNSRKVAGRR